MLIQIHQKAARFGEGSTRTSSHMNQAVEQENEDQNMHVTESEPQGIADQVGEKEDQNMHVIQPEPQGLADEVERIQDIRSNEYEYIENEVVQGANYSSIEAVKDAVKHWAISLRKEFRVVKSTSKEY